MGSKCGIFCTALLVLAGLHDAAAESPSSPRVAQVLVQPTLSYRQLDPASSLAAQFPNAADVSMALVAVPDPRVPRHRRAYDLSIVALIQGMLDAGYALDRYAFPWQEQLNSTDEGKARGQFLTDDCKFGLMVFRRDLWRAPGRQGTSLRALYVVPETTTYGLPRGTTLSAMRQIAVQYAEPMALPAAWCPRVEAGAGGASAVRDAEPPPVPAVEVVDTRMQPGVARLARHVLCRKSGSLLLFGPDFSGSLDSVARISQAARSYGLPSLCAVSPSATAESNQRVAAFPDDGAIEFQPLALSDDDKLAALWRYAVRIGAGDENAIALLTETSVFGNEVCKRSADGMDDERGKLCSNAVRISFPANIADVRAGIVRARKSAPTSEFRGMLPRDPHLSWEEGAGNGSEYPDSLQSSLTAAGAELELRRAIKVLKLLRAKMIIVVATDIRDRLFLFDLLRDEVPNAQLVDLEADTLLAHPDHVDATRGTIAVASQRLSVVRPTEWRTGSPSISFGATDYQVLLRKAVGSMDSRDPFEARGKCVFDGSQDAVLIHAVGRRSLVALDCLSDRQFQQRLFAMPLLATLAVFWILTASPAMRALFGWRTVRPGAEEGRGTWARRFCAWLQAWARTDDPSINPAALRLVAGMGLLLVAAWFAGDRSTFLLALLALPIMSWAMAYQAGAYDMNRMHKARRITRHVGYRLLRHAFSVLALILFLAMLGWWMLQLRHEDEVGVSAIARLAYAADQGMAIGIALLITVLALVYTDNALAVARSASDRNGHVLVHGLGLGPGSDLGRHVGAWFHAAAVPRSPMMALGGLALALCMLAVYPPLKVTVFGALPAWLAAGSALVVSYAALAFFVNAVMMRSRALRIADALKMAQLQSTPGAGTSAQEAAPPKNVIGLWPPVDARRVRFATTPAVARVKDAGEAGMLLLSPDQRGRFASAIGRVRFRGPLGGEARIALYTLFASEVSQTRWATFSSAACSLAVAALVYLYPVSGANAFVVFNLGLLVLTGLFAGYSAMSFERNDVMSNVLCNRTAKMEFSATLFTYTVVPFLILAICLALVQMPGVLDWGEGMFKSVASVAGSKLLQ